MKPNVYIVGFQKCGSSSLFDLLASHPRIVGSEPKETFALVDAQSEHFHPEENIQNPDFSFDRYYSNEASQATYLLEGSVVNFYQETALDYIAAIPHSKVVFILRDPIDRLRSNFRYYSDTGLHIGLNEQMSDYLDKVKNKSYTKEALNFALEHGRYLPYIERWQERLGSERVLVLELHELADNAALNQKLSNFLDVEADGFVQIEKNNVSTGVRFALLNKFFVQHLSGMRKILKNIPGAQKLFKQIITKPIEPNDQDFTHADLQFLRSYYQVELEWLDQKRQNR